MSDIVSGYRSALIIKKTETLSQFQSMINVVVKEKILQVCLEFYFIFVNFDGCVIIRQKISYL